MELRVVWKLWLFNRVMSGAGGIALWSLFGEWRTAFAQLWPRRLSGVDASDQRGDRQHHGGMQHLLIALTLNGDQLTIRFIGLQESWHWWQRGYAVQFPERSEYFIVDKAVFQAVVVQCFAYRHQPFGIFIFMT